MSKPSVGSTVSVGSLLNFFTIVVLPALSSPMIKIFISFSFCRSLRTMVRKPIARRRLRDGPVARRGGASDGEARARDAVLS